MSETKKLDIVQKYYIRNEDGETNYEHPYDLIKKTNFEGLYYVILNEQVGYMNEKGEIVVPIDYDKRRKTYTGFQHYHVSDWHFYDGKTVIAYVYKNNKIGVVNSSGDQIVPCEFEKVGIFEASENFIPVAIPSQDNSKLIWGIYDIKNKHVSVNPQYEEIKKEHNGYASFKENGKWGILHCATGKVVIPAIYLLDMVVTNTGLVIAFLGGSWEYFRGTRNVSPEDCHVLVVNGIEPALLVISGYEWIEKSAPSVMECIIGFQKNPKQKDSFKILKMPNYIGIVKNASYEEGYFLQENGKFVKEYVVGCTSYSAISHAKYVSGGVFSAITYNGEDIPVTNQMKLEILKRISEE